MGKQKRSPMLERWEEPLNLCVWNEGDTTYKDKDGINYDRVELGRKDMLFYEIDDEVNEALKDSQIKEGDMGWCHTFWDKKKEILWKKHKVKWRTPAELNPEIMFD